MTSEVAPERRAAAIREANRTRRSPFGAVWELLRSVVVSLALFALVRVFLVEAFTIPSGSMERTLLVGDFLLVNKMVYGAELPVVGRRVPGLHQPRVGDIIVFQWPVDVKQSFVKRVVGAGGDTVAMREGVLYRNGVRQREPYAVRSPAPDDSPYDAFTWQSEFLVDTVVRTTYRPTRNSWGPLVVPVGSYFVLGDNRDNSLDSRYWGFVADSLVRGRPLLVYFSVRPDRTGAESWSSRMRWRRLGKVIE